jgi:hypothetical protein
VTANRRDLAAGAAFVAIGLFFALNAWFGLRLGTARAMGPGYFPVMLGGVLVLLGLAIGASALGRPGEALGAVSWRGIALVTGALVFFAVTARGLGIAAALGGATVLAALATGRNSPRVALAMAAVLTAFCVLVFLVALRLPYPAIGPWLRG